MMAFLHHTVGWNDPTALLLLFGGFLGGLARAWLSGHATGWCPWPAARGVRWIQMPTRRTMYDILLAGAISVLAPTLGSTALHVTLVGPPLFLLALGFVVGGFGNYVVVASLWKAGVFKDDPRASRPKEDTP